MRKHPVLLGMLMLCIIVGVFFLLVFGVASLSDNRNLFSLKSRVGIVLIEGPIDDARDIVQLLDDFKKNESIKAVVLRIDSPGGGVAPSQEIYQSIVDLKKKKKVVASMGSLAASGGYLIACAADKIVANPGTVTGSISALIHFANAEELLKKIGLQSSVIKSGKFKDMGSPVRKMTPEEVKLLQEVVDDIYDQLLEAISRDRKIDKEELRKIADGRIFTGRQAQKLKLVDEIGDLSHAVRLAGKMAGMKEEPEVLYPKEKKSKLWQLFLKQAVSVLTSEMTKTKTGYDTVQYLYSK